MLGVRFARHLRCPRGWQLAKLRRRGQHAQRVLMALTVPGRYRAALVAGFQGNTKAAPSTASATVSGGMAGCRHLATSGVLALRLLQ